MDCTKLLEEGNQQLQTLYKQKPLDSHGFLRLSCGIPFVFSKANSDCNKYAAASAFRSWWVGSKSKAVVERPVLVQQSNLFFTLILHYKRMSCIRKNHEQSKKVRPWVNSLDFSLQSNVTFDFIHESSYVLKEVPSFSHPILPPPSAHQLASWLAQWYSGLVPPLLPSNRSLPMFVASHSPEQSQQAKFSRPKSRKLTTLYPTTSESASKLIFYHKLINEKQWKG